MNEAVTTMVSETISSTIFISYCHKDNLLIDELLRFLTPLETNKEAVIWSDRRIPVGKPLESKIDEHVHTANIYVLCISANYLNSNACINELKIAIERMKNEDATVISFVLSECRWKDYPEIRQNKVLPYDGQPVLSFSDHGTAFNQLFEKLREDLRIIERQRDLTFTNEFTDNIQQLGILKGFRKDSGVRLSDIYVDPNLRDVSIEKERDDKTIISSDTLPDVIENKKRVVISGPSQSGKTSLCRMLCRRVFEKGFLPVLFSGHSRYQGSFDTLLKTSLKKQYSDCDAIRYSKIVPILDDFHHAKNPDKLLSELSQYERCVLIVDDFYELDLRNQAFLKDFAAFEIIPFGARKRSELIGKWLGVDSTGSSDDARRGIAKLDQTNETVTSALGKVLGKGIMPSFPFFILLIVATLENNQSFGDREISSQGHCYFVLLFIALSQKGVKNDQIDTYLNFLSELSIAMYRSNDELDDDGFSAFMSSYMDSFNLPIRQDEIMGILHRAGIVSKDGFGYYRFTYRYLYFYFVAKYFSDHEQECDREIKELLNGLGESRNAYIAVFLTHHSKSVKALNRILDVAKRCLQDVRNPSLLQEEDLAFFNGHVRRISQASLNAWHDSPAKTREQQLENQERKEELIEESNESESEMVREFVSALRTTEVLGQVIKNRAGSLKKDQLESVIKTILDIHAKIYSQFFSLIQAEGIEESMIEMFAYWLSSHPKIVSRLPQEKIKELASSLFWNINYRAICGITMHCVRSVGSEQLWPILKDVCEGLAAPLGEVIKFGTEVFYRNRVPISTLKKKKDELPIIVWTIIREMIVQYCNTHPMKFDERQQVENLLNVKRTLISYHQKR